MSPLSFPISLSSYSLVFLLYKNITVFLTCQILISLRCKKLKYPKELPQISIIFIFVNEALSVILRSVHSAVNHTPVHLLKEIILVDDNSDEGMIIF